MATERVPATGLELRDWLVRLFPDFAKMLAGSLYIQDDGAFTPHGVCSEFSRYYRTGIPDRSSAQVAELFSVTETIIASDPYDRSAIANALCTCFLENVSCTDEGHAGRAFMGPKSLLFFDGWHYSYLRERGIEPYRGT